MALITCKDCKKEFSTDSKKCPHCGARKPGGIGCLSLIIVICAASWALSSITNTTSVTAPSGISREQQALSNVVLKYDWKKGGFDTVMIADFTITNKNSFSIKDIGISCEHYAQSGTRIDSNQNTIYQTVGAGKTKKIKDFNMGFIHSQAASSSCKVTNLVIGN